MTRLLLPLALVLGALPAWTMMVYVPDSTLLGSSDLIIVGTVISDTLSQASSGWQTGTALAAIRVDRVLYGPNVASVVVRHPSPPQGLIMDHGGFMLPANTQRIFFLRADADGYTLVGGTQGMKDPKEADTYAAQKARYPYTVTLAAPPATIAFDTPVTVTVTVKNNGTDPIEVYHPSLEAYFCAAKLGPIYFQGGQERQGAAPVCPPGQELTVTAHVQCAPPVAWKIFTPDTYLLAQSYIRATVFINPQTAEPQPGQGCHAASAWSLSAIGFPLPAGAQ